MMGEQRRGSPGARVAAALIGGGAVLLLAATVWFSLPLHHPTPGSPAGGAPPADSTRSTGSRSPIAQATPAPTHTGEAPPARAYAVGSSSKRAGTRRSLRHLAPGSDPSVLPGPVLIADSGNNRLIEVSPSGHVLWKFPRRGDLRPGQTFLTPDDAFFSPNGRRVIATQEEDFVISVIDLADSRIVYRYGHAGVPGSTRGYLDNPDDALLLGRGVIHLADIKNCRLLVLRMPDHHIRRQLGRTGLCAHQPNLSFGSPNGWFPMHGGRSVVTEITGDWIDLLSPGGRVLRATHAPGFTYPSDTNEVRPGVLLSADYTNPGAIETFTPRGRLLWRYAPSGKRALNSPSLAAPLPNGDILANDDHNDRVIVIDPHTNRVVWQYGHTHVAGSRPGYLSDPDGVDVAPPYSLLDRFRTHRPGASG